MEAIDIEYIDQYTHQFRFYLLGSDETVTTMEEAEALLTKHKIKFLKVIGWHHGTSRTD